MVSNWQGKTIKYMLKNPLYKGTANYYKENKVKNKELALVQKKFDYFKYLYRKLYKNRKPITKNKDVNLYEFYLRIRYK